MDMAMALGAFVDESRELLSQMEDILPRADAGGVAEDDLNALFRSAHTIKGSGGLFGLDAVVAAALGKQKSAEEKRAAEKRSVKVPADRLDALIDQVGELVIAGAETELDKSMVEKVGDPLMHMVRNAIDHGIEAPERREAAGKPQRGTVALNAYHESGSIVTEVADDGGGLDPQRILTKAIERGCVAPDASLSEEEIHRLILEPGFSTAEQVTNLSGRGVGMDVVKSSIEALRGTLDIESTLGRGSTMRLCLPLTLAIIDGFQVGVGGATYILPLDSVVECIELPRHAQEADYLNLRDQLLPFLRLRSLFDSCGAVPLQQNVVVVRFAGRQAGIAVDRLYGECQTVIKPLGRLFEKAAGISGSTILGSGEVALILDVGQLVQLAVAGDRRPVMARRAKALSEPGGNAEQGEDKCSRS